RKKDVVARSLADRLDDLVGIIARASRDHPRHLESDAPEEPRVESQIDESPVPRTFLDARERAVRRDRERVPRLVKEVRDASRELGIRRQDEEAGGSGSAIGLQRVAQGTLLAPAIRVRSIGSEAASRLSRRERTIPGAGRPRKVRSAPRPSRVGFGRDEISLGEPGEESLAL